jgi:large subunit ribosomal protein L6
MSRVAGAPVVIPSGVEVQLEGQNLVLKGAKGVLQHTVHAGVEVTYGDDNIMSFAPRKGKANAGAMAGTTRALVNNMVTGVSSGFERKLELVGIGYRAQMKGQVLHLTLGYSHPVEFEVPEGLSIETPNPTEIIIKGIDKQQVGQVAAIIRGFRPPEPYKGKGVRYAGEKFVRKVAKKK